MADPDARVRDSFAKQTIMATIGASVALVKSGEVEIVLPFSDKITQQHGFVHAGVVSTIADSACGYAALSVMPADAAVLTTEFKIHLLSPAKGDRLRAVGRVVRAGKKLVITMGEVFAEQGGVEAGRAHHRVDDGGRNADRAAGLTAGASVPPRLHYRGGAARCVRRQNTRGLTILTGAVPGRGRGLGHMAPTYFCRFPGSVLQRPSRLRTLL